jgi:prepilin-type N-terminal cleavage/methylation domain-containing protein
MIVNIIKNNYKKGFTLIELLVVISIISLLSTVILSALSDARAKSKASKLMSDMIQIRNAAELYRNDTGSYPNGGTLASSGLFPKYLPQAPINPFDPSKSYSLRTDISSPRYYYCTGKNIDLTEYELGKLFVYTSVSSSDVKKELFSKYSVLNSTFFDGSAGTIAPCVE